MLRVSGYGGCRAFVNGLLIFWPWPCSSSLLDFFFWDTPSAKQLLSLNWFCLNCWPLPPLAFKRDKFHDKRFLQHAIFVPPQFRHIMVFCMWLFIYLCNVCVYIYIWYLFIYIYIYQYINILIYLRKGRPGTGVKLVLQGLSPGPGGVLGVPEDLGGFHGGPGLGPRGPGVGSLGARAGSLGHEPRLWRALISSK